MAHILMLNIEPLLFFKLSEEKIFFKDFFSKYKESSIFDGIRCLTHNIGSHTFAVSVALSQYPESRPEKKMGGNFCSYVQYAPPPTLDLILAEKIMYFRWDFTVIYGNLCFPYIITCDFKVACSLGIYLNCLYLS